MSYGDVCTEATLKQEKDYKSTFEHAQTAVGVRARRQGRGTAREDGRTKEKANQTDSSRVMKTTAEN